MLKTGSQKSNNDSIKINNYFCYYYYYSVLGTVWIKMAQSPVLMALRVNWGKLIFNQYPNTKLIIIVISTMTGIYKV